MTKEVEEKTPIQLLLAGITHMPQLNLIVQMVKDEKDKSISCDKLIYNINKKPYLVYDNEYARVVVGEDFNSIHFKKDMFTKKAGFIQTWGKTIDNPCNPDVKL